MAGIFELVNATSGFIAGNGSHAQVYKDVYPFLHAQLAPSPKIIYDAKKAWAILPRFGRRGGGMPPKFSVRREPNGASIGFPVGEFCFFRSEGKRHRLASCFGEKSGASSAGPCPLGRIL